MADIITFVSALLEKHYDLGENIRVQAIGKGDANKSFRAFSHKDGEEREWYVRQYNVAEEERDIIYEHAFERYLRTKINGKIQTLLPIATKGGVTWIVEAFHGVNNFYAVYHIMHGREPYSWEYNDLSDVAFDSCAEITAKFQLWAYDFRQPEGGDKCEIPVMALFDQWSEDLPAAIAKKEEEGELYQRFTEYLNRELDFLLCAIQFCRKELKKHEFSLKKCINHKDINPGNLMFDEDDRVCGIFDLDWTNVDYRLYDVAWMGYQITSSWNTKSWGKVSLEKLRRFVQIYDRTMVMWNSPLGALTEEERKFLPVFMIIGALKVIMDFSCYEEHENEVHRMFVNTWRFVDGVHDMMEHLDDMVNAITE